MGARLELYERVREALAADSHALEIIGHLADVDDFAQSDDLDGRLKALQASGIVGRVHGAIGKPVTARMVLETLVIYEHLSPVLGTQYLHRLFRMDRTSAIGVVDGEHYAIGHGPEEAIRRLNVLLYLQRQKKQGATEEQLRMIEAAIERREGFPYNPHG